MKKVFLCFMLLVFIFSGGAVVLTAGVYAAEKEDFIVIEAEGAEEINATVAAMEERHAAEIVSAAADYYDPDFAAHAGLVIAKINGDLPDLSGFNVLEAVATKEGLYYLQLPSAAEAEACVAYLNELDPVVYAERDQLVYVDVDDDSFEKGAEDDVSNDDFPVFADAMSWGVSLIGAPGYATRTAQNNVQDDVVIVAVLDSGVESSHPFLKKHLVNGYDFVDDDHTPEDGDSHGTHVSGIVVDCASGMKIKVMPVRVLDDNGEGWSSRTANGIRYAADHGAHVINMSLSGGGTSEIEREAVNYAIAKNIPVIVSAGNKNDDTANYSPAQFTQCITVAALDSETERRSNSNYGNSVDIAAPGKNINSSVLNGKYDTKSGTSMAAPHVAAAAAMLRYNFPFMTPATIEKTIREKAFDLGEPGWDRYFGAGRLNMTNFNVRSVNTYRLIYDVNGGSQTLSPKFITKGKAYGSLPTPNRSGYHFLGWFTSPKGGVRIYDYSTVNVTANQTLYAHWEGNNYALNLDPMGGEVYPAVVNVVYHSVYGELPIPKRKGYRFSGWYLQQNGGKVLRNNTPVTVIGNHTAYALWEANEYNVTFDLNGGEGVATPKKVKYNSSYGALPQPTRAGYHFAGWSENINGSTVLRETSTVLMARDHTLYAQWRAAVYLVNFDFNGGEDVALFNLATYNSAYGELPQPTRKGYTFAGWYTAGGDAVTATTVVSIVGNHMLFARWEPETYKVTFDLNGGEGVAASKTVKYDFAYGELPQPIWKGYTFAGWYTNTVGGSAVTATSLVSIVGDHTLYARWGPCDWRDNCPSRHFTDVPGPGNWAHEGIDFVVNRGLFNGVSEKQFAPSTTMNRAMMVTVLWRLEGKPKVSSALTFTDVPAGSYYEKAVAWAAEKDIVKGTSPTKFSPNDDIVRQQLAAIMYRYAAYKGIDVQKTASLTAFSDHSDAADYAKNAMGWAVEAKIITGVKEGPWTFLRPRANATRAQVAAICQRFVAKVAP